ncbi:MAG: 4-alpha-glucanotransferase [Actinobacteria bacterium]|nr:4-alpha-glucanotransferase [Actinomycetota bacterium]
MSGGAAAAPDAWGIVSGYEDAFGEWTDVPVETRDALVAAMGGDPAADGPPASDAVHVVRAGEPVDVAGAVRVELEEGGGRDLDGHVPGDLPLGYHDLEVRGEDDPRRLIVSPGTCHLPDDLRTWGWAAQLYAVRSDDSWGIGDLGDLRRLAAWSARLGAGTLLINPLAAVDPLTPRETSPYYPTSRRFLDPVYARIAEVPGAAHADLGDLPARAAELNEVREIDRDEVAAIKLAALERCYAEVSGGLDADAGYRRFLDERGPDLDRFAIHQTLTELHGDRWRSWPEGLQAPSSPGVHRVAADRVDRVRFHRWVQFVLDDQLRRAGEPLALLGDLPIGSDPDGADAWMWQDVLAEGVTVGAPPDMLGPQGQDWSLPAFVPWKLRAARYQPFVDTLRSAFRHVGGLRIDHVLGLFRMFWIPPGGTAADGAYVRQHTRELLDILALESHRAGAFVVGEDLGTVEAGVREELAARRILRYQVWWFEEDPIDEWARDALASVTTHDLPTVAGVWTGEDARMQRGVGLDPDLAWHDELRTRIRRAAGVPRDAAVRDVVVALHERLARAPDRLVVTQLEDALGLHDRPNVPGTTRDVRANWSLALPVLLEELEEHPTVAAVASALSRARPR